MLHSIYDLTTLCRKASGDIPPKLVGASTTVIGSKMYLFGGRLVTERRMVADLYTFDLETFEWEYILPSPEDVIPRPRYFHSTDAWNNYLVLFGGMSNRPDSLNPEELCVLNDVRFFDLESRHWLAEAPLDLPPGDHRIPRARYAHLSSISANRLFIIGGQDFYNTWLDDVCVYDLDAKSWVQKRDYPRHCGTYRSVAVSSTTTVRLAQDEVQASHTSSVLGPSGARFQVDKSSPLTEVTPSSTLTHLPYTARPTDEHPSDIFLYSNYNFTDVKRELEVFSPLPDSDFTIEDRSSAMTGSTFPPGLRFPTGAVLGSHLIIAGTYLAHSYQSFSIWVLDLTTMTWSRIDPGKAIETGSWFRGCLWAEGNKFLIFGNRNGNLVDDYNRRLLSWDHVAVVDLEAFGIYQPPSLKLDIRMQELGLAALEEKSLTDFEIVCDDGRKIPCSRKVLEDRWPWFKLQRTRMLEQAQAALTKLPASVIYASPPELPGKATVEDPPLDPRLTPRALFLSEPWPVTMALLQYFYSLALITPLQHAPAVLSQLLMLGTTYQLDHLVSLVKHAMHRALSNSTSVGVYEVATLCSCRSLQIRALKTVMSYTQKRPSKSSRPERDGGNDRYPDSGPGGLNGTNGGHEGSHGDSHISSRPRGTSDARWRTTSSTNGISSGYTTRAGGVLPTIPTEQPAEAEETRVKSFHPSHEHQSSGSAPPPKVIESKIQSRVLPAPPTGKHMAQTEHRSIPSKSSDEWCLVSPPLIMGHQKPIPGLVTLSGKQVAPQHKHTGNPTDPKMPTSSRIPTNTHIPPRHRPSPILVGIPISGGQDSTDFNGPVSDPSPSTSQTSFSSSPHDLLTPWTPAHKKDTKFPKIQGPSRPSGKNDMDEEFTIVLSEDEAIHWTKQTSDLRQPSPTRPSWAGYTTGHFSHSSPHPKQPESPTKLSSPFPPSTQSSASPTKSEGYHIGHSQKIKGWFSPSKKPKSPTQLREGGRVTTYRGMGGMVLV